MGVGLVAVEYLGVARDEGVRFERTATIGRQSMFIGPRLAWRLLARRATPPAMSRRAFLESFRRAPWMADPVFLALGASELSTIDASAFEGASIVHDMNVPIPEELRERFSLVFDGGSLEHIFDVPTVLRNYMEMVEPGGHLIVHTTANNHLGHGFYQFSPEFFFRVFTAENGFDVEQVVAVVNDVSWGRVAGFGVPFERKGPWYEVSDPARVRQRVVLEGEGPVVLYVRAKRTRVVPVLQGPPQQSDYAAAWSAHEDVQQVVAPPGPSKLARLIERVPVEVRMDLWMGLVPRLLPFLNPTWFGRQGRERSFRNRRFYRRIGS